MKEKLLYFMHVDWHWIKQRPHFLAEGLSATFAVLAAHPVSNKRTQLVRNRSDVRRAPLWTLPFPRLGSIAFINAIIMNLYFIVLMTVFRPAIVWFTFPALVPMVGWRLLKNKVVVYDCMDDAPEFFTRDKEKLALLDKEKRLLACADIILVSSDNLHVKLTRRGADPGKIALVRNAFGGIVHEEVAASPNADKKNGMLRILFIGAVGSHLDFDVILHCVGKLQAVEFNFIGPITTSVPKHDRLKYHSAVEHASLPSHVQHYDIFIMPFKVNELIQGVDPVKLYEYINFNKNIVCPYYPEIERFGEFVHFYRDRDEFVAVIEKLVNRNERKYDQRRRRIFLEDNSWNERTETVVKLINKNLLSKMSPLARQQQPRSYGP